MDCGSIILLAWIASIPILVIIFFITEKLFPIPEIDIDALWEETRLENLAEIQDIQKKLKERGLKRENSESGSKESGERLLQ